jgi:hypothetical protein
MALDGDTKGNLALGLALVDSLALAELTLPQAQAFFLVATHEGHPVTDYAVRAGTSETDMSRRLSDLGTRDRHMQPGLGLVEGNTATAYVLTPKGVAVAERIARAMRFARAS